MFKKILIANRGEIAARIIRTCRDMGIATVALYELPDQYSLHVRLAEEAVLLRVPGAFTDSQTILDIAREKGAEAVHPGYGFMAERPEFARACAQAGIVFIGPPAEVLDVATDKTETLTRVKAAGFPTVPGTTQSFDADDVALVRAAAEELGYPLIIKSVRGGRGRGEKLVRTTDRLEEALRRAAAESQAVFGSTRIYLEKAMTAAHQVCVQIFGDSAGNVIQLGDREGSILRGNQKIIEEAPAPCLSPSQREQIQAAAVAIAKLLGYQNSGSVEFLIDAEGRYFFTEIKPRLQVEHPLSEQVAHIDLVREQIRVAAGELLPAKLADFTPRGWAMLCRLSAEDPRNNYLPAPGQLRRVSMPGGPGVRVDTYVSTDCTVPGEYDPLIAKITVWGADRPTCVERMRRALEEISITGVPTNLALLRRLIDLPEIINGTYNTDLQVSTAHYPAPMEHNRDMAVAAAVYYARRSQVFRPETPERITTGWHRSSRRLPE